MKKGLAYKMLADKKAAKQPEKKEEKKFESKHLTKQVAIAVLKHQDMPYRKVEFTSLADYALDVVAKNLEKYPALQGLPENYREKV